MRPLKPKKRRSSRSAEARVYNHGSGTKSTPNETADNRAQALARQMVAASLVFPEEPRAFDGPGLRAPLPWRGSNCGARPLSQRALPASSRADRSRARHARPKPMG